MKRLTRILLLAALLGVTPAAWAQTPTPALPAWEHLAPAQREALVAPIRERWNSQPGERARMLERAQRWRAMSAEQRQRAHRGMKRWEHMDPAKRERMRAVFERMRHATPAERKALRERWRAMTPEQRKAWIEANRPADPPPRR